MLLYRLGPEGFFAVSAPAAPGHSSEQLRLLHSDPFTTPPARWELGREVSPQNLQLLAPVLPGKIIGIGRNYREHAREMSNEVPSEPLLFLKAPSSLIGPNAPVVLPPESERVEFEGEIAVVLRTRLRRADAAAAAQAVLGVTCACDVTARDLQHRDPTWARAKSFDTFCPLGPAIAVSSDADGLADLADLTVVTRLNGVERQRGQTREMVFAIPDLLAYASRMMTLEPGDVVLTGTPAGVGPLAEGDLIEVEISGVGVLRNRVEVFAG